MDLVKEWSSKVIQRTCNELSLSEDLITLVHQDQWKRARKAAKTCNTIEFCGLGKVKARPQKVKKLLTSYTNLKNAWEKIKLEETDPGKLRGLEIKLTQIEPKIEALKNRMEKMNNEH